MHLSDMTKAHRQLMVLSAYFSRDAFKIYTSGITMQRYNSMLSSSIIFIFQSLIIRTDNLMIFLEDSRLVETMYVLFSYLIWKMAAYINIHYLACSRHPTLAFVGKKKKVFLLTNINYNRVVGGDSEEGKILSYNAVTPRWVPKHGNTLKCIPVFHKFSAVSGANCLKAYWWEWSCTAVSIIAAVLG